MIYSETMQSAVHFAITTHEVNQQQKRKGKDIAYITHPLTVALILARAGADEDTVVAGILHDTVEDSSPEFPVTLETLEAAFGSAVTSLVETVTELPKSVDWNERKTEALNRIATYSRQSVLIKSADVMANDWELISDIREGGDAVFARFNVSRDERLHHQHQMIDALVKRWPESPLADDLRVLDAELSSLGSGEPAISMHRSNIQPPVRQ